MSSSKAAPSLLLRQLSWSFLLGLNTTSPQAAAGAIETSALMRIISSVCHRVPDVSLKDATAWRRHVADGASPPSGTSCPLPGCFHFRCRQEAKRKQSISKAFTVFCLWDREAAALDSDAPLAIPCTPRPSPPVCSS